VSPVRTRRQEADEVCAQAVDFARDAIETLVGPDLVGDHLGIEVDGERVVTHLFACLDIGYPGWRWAVTVTRAARAKTVTMSESVLLPGPEALLAPEWVPWRDRLQPGDVGVGDLLPAGDDDERLVPLVALDGGEAWGRARVLSPIGREMTADRWHSSDHGPGTALTHAAPASCVSCGFYVPLSADLGRMFGACANAYAPDDGRVVSVDHGCGAHSEAVLAGGPGQALVPVIDEFGYDLVDLPGVSVEETVFEPLSRET
jgi:hypothetical protein